MKLKRNSLIIITCFFLNYLIGEGLFEIAIIFFTPTERLLLFCSIIGNIIFGYILYRLYKKEILKEFKIIKNNFKKITEKALKYWITGLLGMITTNIIIGYLLKSLPENETLVRDLFFDYPILMALSIIIIAPFLEEVIFRKVLNKVIQKKWLYIITSGIIFGTIHALTGITEPIELLYIIPYGILGSTFAYTYYETKTIWATISTHALHNAISMLILVIL